MSVSVACAECGIEFLPSRKTMRFCGAGCRIKSWLRDHPPQARGPERTASCVWCKKSFQTTDRRKQFCSTPCRHEYRNRLRPVTKLEWRECPVCATKFQPKQARGVGKKYCSEKCRAEASYDRRRPIAGDWRKPLHWETKWGGTWWAALVRDDFTCQVCRRRSRPMRSLGRDGLVVHHLDCTGEHNEKNHSLDNLMTVCAGCHRLFHSTISLVRLDGRWVVEGEIFKRLQIGAVETIYRAGKAL